MSDTAARFLRLPQVAAKIGLGRSTIYRQMEAGTFPTPRQIGAKAVAWLESDVDAWMMAQPASTPRCRQQGADRLEPV